MDLYQDQRRGLGVSNPRKLREALRRFGDAAHELAEALGDEQSPPVETKRRRRVVVTMPEEPVSDLEVAKALQILKRGK